VVGGGAVRAADRHAVRHADRLALGAHRGHLHDHDHAGHRRGVLLPGAAELQHLQRLPGAARAEGAVVLGRELARPGALLLPGAGRDDMEAQCGHAPRVVADALQRDAERRSRATSR
jgi:hypothetical protein